MTAQTGWHPAERWAWAAGADATAVHLAKHGWKVTAADGVEEALAKARQRAAEEGVEVH